jgi:hypothetical protein
MIVREHCADCDKSLGKHKFVSLDGGRLLCGRCFGLRDTAADRGTEERDGHRLRRALMRRRTT